LQIGQMNELPLVEEVDATAGMKGRIERRSLHAELVERIRQMIFDGALAAGEKIPERELTERFGVSRTPLREALKVLASEGLVILAPNRGASVIAMTESDLRQGFPVMAVLEALAGELACRSITDAEIERIEKLQKAMRECFDNSDLNGYFRLNEAIHLAILQAADNPILTSIYHGVSARIRRARYRANMSLSRWKQAIAEHDEILAALKQRNGKRTFDIMKRHLEAKQHSLELSPHDKR